MRDLNGQGRGVEILPRRAVERLGAPPEDNKVVLDIASSALPLTAASTFVGEIIETLPVNQYENSSFIANARSSSLAALSDINKNTPSKPNKQHDLISGASLVDSSQSDSNSPPNSSTHFDNNISNNGTLKHNSRRNRTSSERSSVSQLMSDKSRNQQQVHRRTPSADKGNLAQSEVCSSDGSRSSNTSLAASKPGSSPQHSLHSNHKKSASEHISEYLNTDTMRRGSGTTTTAAHLVKSSTSVPSPTIYYTTRPTRNTTPEKHRRKKSLGSYACDEIPSLMKNGRTKSRESFERNLSNTNENVGYT